MKWYSVKKYSSVNYCQPHFVVTQDRRLWVAKLDYDDKWHLCSDSSYELKRVTHFCIPDAVEIEE